MSLVKYKDHLFIDTIKNNSKDKVMEFITGYIDNISYEELLKLADNKDDKTIIDLLLAKYGDDIIKSSEKYKLNAQNRLNKRTKYIVKILRQYKCNIDKYLDIGATNCMFANIMGHNLEIKNDNIYGIDIETWMSRDYDKSNKCQFKFYDGKNIPFEDNTFDLITIFQTLHHVPDTENMIKQIRNKLKNNKYLVIREHNIENKNEEMMVEMEHLLDEAFLERNEYKKIIDTHYAKYKNMKEWSRQLQRHGFKLLRYFNINVGPTKIYNAIYRLSKN